MGISALRRDRGQIDKVDKIHVAERVEIDAVNYSKSIYYSVRKIIKPLQNVFLRTYVLNVLNFDIPSDVRTGLVVILSRNFLNGS